MDMRGHDALVGASYAEVVQRPQGYWDREQTKIGQRINDVVDRVKNAVHIGWCALTMDSNSLAFEKQIIDHEKEMKQEWRELGPTDQAGAPRPAIDRDGLTALETMAADLTAATEPMIERLHEIATEQEQQMSLFPELGVEHAREQEYQSAIRVGIAYFDYEVSKDQALNMLSKSILGKDGVSVDEIGWSLYSQVERIETLAHEWARQGISRDDVEGILNESIKSAAAMDRTLGKQQEIEYELMSGERPFSMTLDKLREDKWSVLDLTLPDNAGMDLLQAAETAARECYDEACSEIAGYDPEDADSTGYAYEQSFNRDQAQEVLNVVGERIAEKLREEPGYYDAGGGFANDGKWVSANEDREVETLERDDEGLEL